MYIQQKLTETGNLSDSRRARPSSLWPATIARTIYYISVFIVMTHFLWQYNIYLLLFIIIQNSVGSRIDVRHGRTKKSGAVDSLALYTRTFCYIVQTIMNQQFTYTNKTMYYYIDRKFIFAGICIENNQNKYLPNNILYFRLKKTKHTIIISQGKLAKFSFK